LRVGQRLYEIRSVELHFLEVLMPGLRTLIALSFLIPSSDVAAQTLSKPKPLESETKKAELECANLRAKGQGGQTLSDDERLRLIACARWDEDKRKPTYRAYIPREALGNRVDG
jgi:hypothetical protein